MKGEHNTKSNFPGSNSLLDFFPTSVPSLQPDATLRPVPHQSQNFMAHSHPKVSSNAQGQKWGNPYLYSPLGPGSLSRSLPPFTPQLILPCHTTLWAFVAGNLAPALGHSWRSLPLSQIWHLSRGTRCLQGRAADTHS